MKFKAPENNAIRIKEKFALLPVKIDNGDTIWLEKYYAAQMYATYIHLDTKAELTTWMTRYTSQKPIDEETARVLIEEKSRKWIDDELAKHRRKLGI